jgi:death-on-curing protein
MAILYLEINDVEEINRKILKIQRVGYLYKSGVLYALDQVKYEYEQLVEREAIIGKAAYLWHSIAFNQCFADGNKRTAFVTADTFLRINGIHFGADVNYKHQISSGIALNQYNIGDVRDLISQSLK